MEGPTRQHHSTPARELIQEAGGKDVVFGDLLSQKKGNCPLGRGEPAEHSTHDRRCFFFAVKTRRNPTAGVKGIRSGENTAYQERLRF